VKIKTGARSSPLSRAQFEEARSLMPARLVLEPVWVGSPGDRDRTTSLRDLDRTDFFTRDLDQMLLLKMIRLAIHSAKDLPDPLPDGLALALMTKGIDPRDSLVFREGDSLSTLPSGAVIATSSSRREEVVKRLRGDLIFIDLRGDVEERLAKLTDGADGVVIAEAALIRLKLTHLNRLILLGETAPGQGKLALVTRADDRELIQCLESCI
jgi:hydroxymethylbilane synthase